jgi:hypothetical protein
MNNKIESVVVESSAINCADYYPQDKVMVVYFKNESIYNYLDVPYFCFRGLFDAESKGKFLNKYVIKKFTFNKIN